MFNDFLEYINKFISNEELAFAFLGLIFLIAIWIEGRKVWKGTTKAERRKKINVFGADYTIKSMDCNITRATKIFCIYRYCVRTSAIVYCFIVY